MTTWQTSTVPAYIDALLSGLELATSDLGVVVVDGDTRPGPIDVMVIGGADQSEIGGEGQDRQWATLGKPTGNTRVESYRLNVVVSLQRPGRTASEARALAFDAYGRFCEVVEGRWTLNAAGHPSVTLGVSAATDGCIVSAVPVPASWTPIATDQGMTYVLSTGVVVTAQLRVI